MLIIEAPPGDRFAERNKRTFLLAKARHGCNIEWQGEQGRDETEPDRRARGHVYFARDGKAIGFDVSGAGHCGIFLHPGKGGGGAI